MNKYYQCIKCGQKYPFSKEILTCSHHSPYYGHLVLVYDYQNLNLETKADSWEKYLDLLPVQSLKVNFNEQPTPLIKLKNLGEQLGLANLYLKDESKNPTGSFKDRESIIALNQALEWGIKKVFVVSSGNAALSTAAYAQKAGIGCDCLISQSTSVGKRFLISLYGGQLIEKKGIYEEIYRWAIDSSYPGWNCTPGLNPLKEEGIKMIGFEIWEKIGVPELIVVPCGNGTLLWGIYKAFKELVYLGLTEKMPQLIGVQIKGAAPLKAALDQGQDFVVLREMASSIAEGVIGAQESYSSPKAILALKETDGKILLVNDKEIKEAMKAVIKKESIIPEPASATVFCALKKLNLKRDQKIVLVQTASGTKNLKQIMEVIFNK